MQCVQARHIPWWKDYYRWFTTSNLVSRLKYKDKPEYNEYQKKNEEIEETCVLTASTSNSDRPKQLTLSSKL